MKFYHTTKGSWITDEKGPLYQGESLDEAKEAVPDQIKPHEVSKDNFPTKYPYLFAALFESTPRKMLAFYSVESNWVSIVVTDTEETNP